MVEMRTRFGLKVAHVMSELESFHRFLGDRLAHGDFALTLEECLDLWRAQNPPGEDVETDTQGIGRRSKT
jgi:hypothetical protein